MEEECIWGREREQLEGATRRSAAREIVFGIECIEREKDKMKMLKN